MLPVFDNHNAKKFTSHIFFQGMLDEADGPMNFTQMVTLFASKMAGGTDDDETILKSFEVRSPKFLVPDREIKSTLV
jgi:hypothetical protein